MQFLEPTTAPEMAAMLREAAVRKQRIRVGGHFSKRLMAGPNDAAAEVTVSTNRLDRVLAYDPRDLTISVEAGLPYRRLQRTLAEHRQMIPLDPGFDEHATIGGVVAANMSGPRRRQYGTARDLVIGMQFAMLNGRLVQSGGMVVKNVAGLDMGKLLIGSFGTLAAITVLNFKLLPMPGAERTYAVQFSDLTGAMAARDLLIRGAVQPGAIDLLNPTMSAGLGFHAWTLLLWFGGNESLMRRCDREIALLGHPQKTEPHIWETIQNLTPRFLDKFTGGAVVRVSCLLDELPAVMHEIDVPAIARAGTGVVYLYFHRAEPAASWVRQACARGRSALMQFASEESRATFDLWPNPGGDLAIMRKIKHLFDPDTLLNRGRLYRHL